MKKLEIDHQNRVLIESVIRDNPDFSGHEDLLDVLCDAVYKKTYLLIDTIKDSMRLRKHLVSVCSECLHQILIKEKPSVSHEEKNKVNTQPKTDSAFSEIVSLRNNIPNENDEQKNYDISKVQDGIVNLRQAIEESQGRGTLKSLIDPIEFFPPKSVSKSTINKILYMVKGASLKYPNKRYFDIFYLRYIKNLSHVDIAQRLSISQSELSRRFVEMTSLIKRI